MKRIVSVSLGSSAGNKTAEVEYLGERFSIERIGSDGDMDKACRTIAELDGKVAAIGLGGIDLYVMAAGRRYVIRDALKMARAARTTPVVDGSGLKAAWEPVVIQRIVERGLLHPQQKERGLENLKVLMPSGVDRFGIAEAFSKLNTRNIFGDFIFALGLPVRLTRLWQLQLAARTLLPLVCRMPFSMLYPTGGKQDKPTPKYRRYFDWADVIAGDKHYITRSMPPSQEGEAPLAGKVVITNTVRKRDIADFQARGLARLITTTPELNGETLGTNAMQGLVVALLEKAPEDITAEEYLEMIGKIGWKPWVLDL